MSTKGKKFEKIGPTQQKIMLLLLGGATLALAANPKTQFRVIRGIAREWKKINERQLRRSIRKLYESKLVGLQEAEDGTQIMTLTEKGKKKILKYKLDELSIPVPEKWDGKYRFVCFDIPEGAKDARDALRETLQKLGFYKVQKSVFVYPYECKDQIDFVVELFGVRRYVRYGTLDSIDIDLHIRKHFKLI